MWKASVTTDPVPAWGQVVLGAQCLPALPQARFTDALEQRLVFTSRATRTSTAGARKTGCSPGFLCPASPPRMGGDMGSQRSHASALSGSPAPTTLFHVRREMLQSLHPPSPPPALPWKPRNKQTQERHSQHAQVQGCSASVGNRTKNLLVNQVVITWEFNANIKEVTLSRTMWQQRGLIEFQGGLQSLCDKRRGKWGAREVTHLLLS